MNVKKFKLISQTELFQLLGLIQNLGFNHEPFVSVGITIELEVFWKINSVLAFLFLNMLFYLEY